MSRTRNFAAGRLPVPRAIAQAAAAAVLAGPLMPAAAADYIWSNGEFVAGVTSPGLLGPGDRLVIQAGGTKQFNVGDVLTNGGRVNWLADPLYGANAAVVNNTGLWDVQGDTATLVWNSGAQPVFTNTGEFRKSAGVLSQVGNWSFVNNGGTLHAQTGTLRFNGGYAAFNAGSRFIGAGINEIASAATFAGDFRSDNLRLAGGIVTGAAARLAGGTATAGTVDFAAGDLRGSWEVGAGTTLQGVAGATKQLNVGLAMVNNGSVLWKTTESLYMANGAVITNNGLFDAQAAGTMVWNAGALPSFVNAATGTLRAANNITFNVGNVNVVNNGGRLVAGAGGNLVFNGGSATFNDGTRFLGAGRNLVTSAARWVGGYTSDNLEIAGGLQTGGDGVTPGSRAIARGTTAWTGADLRGAWEIAAGHTWVGRTGSTKQLNVSLDLVNNGSFLWQTTDTLYAASGALLTNRGLFEAQANATAVWNAGALPTLANEAGGTLRAADGVTFNIGTMRLVNDGTLDAGAGAVLGYTGGNAVFNTGSRFTGAGRNLVSSAATWNGTMQSGNLEIAGGLQQGNAAVLQGTTRWTGGDLRGTWQVAAGHTLQGHDGSTKQLNVGLNLVNNGTVQWKTANSMFMANGAVVTNNGLFEAQAGTSLVWNAGAVPSFVNSASGTVRAADGVLLAVGGMAFVNNAGTIDAGTGAVVQFGGGNAQFNAFTKFTGAGINRVTAAATFAGTYNAANLELAGGVLTGNGANARGTTTWSAGDVRGTWTLASAHTMQAIAGGSKQLNVSAQVVNNGVIAWQSDDALLMANGAQFTNNGIVEFQAGGDVVWNAGAAPSFVNAGLIRKTGGTETSLASAPLVHTGTIETLAGAIRLPNGFTNVGTLAGAGSFVSSLITNQGTVAPGSPTGALDIRGNFAQSAVGTLAMDVRNTTRRDRLLVSGTAALGGTLAVRCFASCSRLVVGNELMILDSVGEMTGTFANVTLTGFAGTFDVIYDAAGDQVLLRVASLAGGPGGWAGTQGPAMAAAVPEPGTYALMGAGLGLLGWWKRRRAAGGGDPRA